VNDREELRQIKEYQLQLIREAFGGFLRLDFRQKHRVLRHTMSNLRRTAELFGGDTR